MPIILFWVLNLNGFLFFSSVVLLLMRSCKSRDNAPATMTIINHVNNFMYLNLSLNMMFFRQNNGSLIRGFARLLHVHAPLRGQEIIEEKQLV